MEIWLWLVGAMAAVIVCLLIKIYLMQRTAREIETAFADRLVTDTNTLIDISSRDKYMRSLANAINIQLRKLRAQRQRFQQGDAELKNAVANISHDLRTPLTAICGYLDLLEQEENREKAAQYLEVIRNRTEMLALLTEELFRYSVITSDKGEIKREPVEVNRILEESIASFYTVLKERGITPNIQMPEKKIICMVNSSSLARVFANLLQNAIRYSDGDLDIALSETEGIVFANTASGLNAVQVGRLFERFYTVEAARKSTGLGLAIARTLVEQMGGTISAEYEGNRLQIRIWFPGGISEDKTKQKI